MIVQLSLLNAEANLTLGDLPGAYHALDRVYRSERTLMQTLQMTGLQTQYEISAGYDQRALDGVAKRIELAELMPAPQCGLMHHMLSLAAERTEQHKLADWCRRRAALLCTPAQLEQARNGVTGFTTADSPLEAET